MEALKILRRIAYYLLFIVASTIFYKETLSLAFFPYTEAWETFSFDLLLKDMYLPVLYAMLSLGIALISQFLLIGKPKDVETTVYPWTLMVYFGIGAAAAIVILAIGLVRIPSEPINKNPLFLVVPIIVALLFTLGEVLWGILCFLKNKRAEKAKERERIEKEKKEAQVSLTKEE